MVRYRYPPEALAEAAASSHSITGVMRALGVRISGGSHAHISRQLKRFGIDTSHFTGSGHNKGHRSVRRTTSSQLLVRLPAGSRRTPGTRLKWALADIGVPEECEECGVGSSWRGRPLTLHVDRVNGDFLDNRPPNLRMLCPNCHSQTDTYAGRNRNSPSPIDQSRSPVAPGPTPDGALPLKEAEEVVRRVEAVLLGPSEAARQIRCHRNHIARLRRRLATRGTLLTAPDSFRATRTAARDEIVIGHALANPGLGPRKLAELVKAHGTVSNILRRAGLHTASPRRSRLIRSAGVAERQTRRP